MDRKRGGFVPIGDVVADVDLPGVPVPTRRERAPQARRHFTTLDQVTQLVAARDADPDLGFMARLARALFAAAHEPRRPLSARPA